MTGYEHFVQEKFKTPDATLVDIQKLTPCDAAFIHAGMGIFGEVSELLTATDRANLKEELGDAIFFLTAALPLVGMGPTDLSDIDDSLIFAEAKTRLFRSSLDLFDICKKRLVYAKPMSEALTIELLGDIEQCLYVICKFYGFDWNDVINDNIRKLSQRYKAGFSNTEAQQRADKKMASDINPIRLP